MIQLPKFSNKKELHKFLYENKDTIISAKKSEIKRGDAVNYTHAIDESGKLFSLKEDFKPIDIAPLDSLKVTAIINTTNIMDSFYDVHIPGIWTKSLQENKFIKHLREHEMEFDYIIADKQDLKAYAKYFKWSELGQDYQGMTQALVFESTIRKTRNPFMLNQYANGWVDNHSVGMRYIRLGIAMDDPEYPNENDAWLKYYPEIANKDLADEIGYFYYVLEAQVIEGSAVPIGANRVTPTLSVGTKEFQELRDEIKDMKNIINSINVPSKEPAKSTHSKDMQEIELLQLIKTKI
jgi:hypothetical protein